MSSDRRDGPEYKDTREVPAFKGGSAEHAFMSEMMHRLDTLQSSVDSVRRDMQEEIRKHGTASYKAHEETRKHVTTLTQMVRVLWTNVKGSEPPPPPGLSYSMSDPNFVVGEKNPIHRQVSEHDASLASVQGHLIAVDASLNELKSLQREQMGKHTEGIVGLKKLTESMSWLLNTSDGRKSLMLFIVFAVTVYERAMWLLRHY